ncbi:MAG: urease accessory protein UreD, partial [Myxococcaceae bacterium]|nr:urease accessory protein UreD [Myxococcaceae bacterium]
MLEPPRRAPTAASAIVRAGDHRSDVHRARSAGPLRLLFPRAAGRAAWIVTSSLGGGLVHGDDVSLAVTVDPGATALLTTQSSTKVY